ncbi:NAD(P)-dependent oxidoreductase [Occallatibacter riparius]|uniref:NAD(P)-dependent oxidoreductase n=1 Tax=Occallatibacter riparius TaxID=1002689 RepID=A0A9J7BMW0_9BACT|nr:NAD(P)-dependent oxidoreductase [Occallatibacter riparius]UWZ83975.1 NAD(P)-dependent oxidoreductase [Occallatibacter riparius]
MRIGFLGTGAMGTPMAHRLIAAGHELAVWNRSEGKTESLLREGAIAAGTPAEAELGADAVITMLFDDHANEEVLFGPNGLMDALTPSTLHIACSTISVAFSERLTREHERRGIPFIAAPVFGRPNVAEAGKLWIAIAGPDDLIERARPILQPMSRGISVVGKHPPQAHALKLGGNFLISAMIHSLGESFVYAQAQGIEPEVFFETVNSALFQSPFYAAYANVMLHPPEHVGATISLGAKDLRLLREAAAAAGVRLSLADNLAEIFDEARRTGLANEDWAVGQYKMAQRRGKLKADG